MNVRDRLKDPTVRLRIGLLLLILASTSKWFLHPGVHLSEDFVDAATGFLYGGSIAFIILSFRRSACRTSL